MQIPPDRSPFKSVPRSASNGETNVQTLLPGTAGPSKSTSNGNTDTLRKPAPNYKVRMDPSNRTLDSMISVPHPLQIGSFVESTGMEEVERPSKRRAIDDDGMGIELELEEDTRMEVDNSAWTKGSVVIPESECEFTSIHQLRREAGPGNQGTSSDVAGFRRGLMNQM